MFRKTLTITVLLATVVATGCGGGGDKNGSGNELARADQLRVTQDLADFIEFCSASSLKSQALYDRALEVAIVATPDMIETYRKNPDKIFVDEIMKKREPMRQVLNEQAQTLATKCGPDGKKFAQQMRTALQSGGNNPG